MCPFFVFRHGREIKDQRATYSAAARVLCTAVAAVMELRTTANVATYGMSYVQYLLQSSSERATYTSMSTAQNGAEHLICTVAAVMELRMSCQRCYNTYGMHNVQFLQQQLLRSYLSTQLRCGPSHVSFFVFR